MTVPVENPPSNTLRERATDAASDLRDRLTPSNPISSSIAEYVPWLYRQGRRAYISYIVGTVSLVLIILGVVLLNLKSAGKAVKTVGAIIPQTRAATIVADTLDGS